MVDRITMNKGVALGYGNLDDLELVGRAFGYDIYNEEETPTYRTVWVYDRNVTKRVRTLYGDMETRYRIVAKVELSKERGAWHVDLLSVDSRYKGNNLAIKIYKFLMRKMDITLKAGTKKSPYSKVFDFPKAGNRELVSKVFDLYDSDAEIFAVAG